MRYLSLFSGIEACSAAFGPLGWECAAVAEIEPFPCEVLKHRYPNIPNLGDVTKITELDIRALGHIDAVVFGAPCQDLSVAGLRKGLKHADGSLTRSGLFFTACEIAEWANPRWTIWENVPGAFSSQGGRDFAAVVGELSGAEIGVPGDGWANSGVALGPKGLVEWVVLDAQFVRVESHARAVPQRRRRVFVIRDSGDWQSRAPLFLEPAGLCGNPPPSRSTGEGFTHSVAPCIGASGRGFERGGDTRGQDAVIAIPEVCGCLSDGAHNGGGLTGRTPTPGESSPLAPEPFCAGTGQAGTEILQGLCPTLNCNHEQPYIAGQVAVLRGHSDYGDGMPCLRSAGGDAGGDAGGGSEVLIAGPVAHALTGNGHDASEDGTGRGTPLVACIQVAEAWDMRGREGGAQFEGPHDTANIRAGSGGSSRSYVATREVAQALTSNYGKQPDNSDTAQGPNLVTETIAFNARQDPDVYTGHTGPLDTDGGTQAIYIEALQRKGLNESYASTQEADASEALRALQSKVGEKAFTEWGSRILDSLQSQEVLQLALHGRGIRRAAREIGLWMDDGALPCAESLPSGALREMWKNGPDGRSPQGRGLAQQLAKQFGTALSFMSHEGASRMQVRRLTPKECERLMGLPDGWTDIPIKGKRAKDGPRYKALGNSMAVNCMRLIGERIQAASESK